MTVILTGRIEVPEEFAEQAKQEMEAQLRSVVDRFPSAAFKEVCDIGERWGRWDRHAEEEDAARVVLDNNAMCERPSLPSELADEV